MISLIWWLLSIAIRSLLLTLIIIVIVPVLGIGLVVLVLLLVALLRRLGAELQCLLIAHLVSLLLRKRLRIGLLISLIVILLCISFQPTAWLISCDLITGYLLLLSYDRAYPTLSNSGTLINVVITCLKLAWPLLILRPFTLILLITVGLVVVLLVILISLRSLDFVLNIPLRRILMILL